MQEIKQSESTAARRQIYFVAKDVNNPSQPKTGITWAAADIQVSKNGGAAANSAGTVTEVDSTNFPGLYYYQATSTEVNTLGSILLNFKNTAMVAQIQEITIVAYDPFDAVRLGLTALPNATANAAGGLMTAGTGTNQISASGGIVQADVERWRSVLPNALSAAGNVQVDLEEWRAVIPAGLTATLVQTNMNTSSSGAITRATYAQDAKDLFREVGRDTAAAGAAGTITLGASASATANIYIDHIVGIVGGTGAGQARRITAYTAGKVATVVPNWTTTPDATSVYELFGGTGVDVRTWGGSTAAPTTVNALVSGRVDASVGAMAANVLTASAVAASALTSAKFDNTVNIQIARTGTAQAGSTSTTIKLDASASAVDNLYNELICYIVSGTGAGQSRQVTGYVGSTKVATVDAAWATTPDATSVFQLLPTAAGGVSGTVNANVVQWQGSAPSALNSGAVQADLVQWRGSTPVALDAGGYVGVDVNAWVGTAVETPTTGGRPIVQARVIDDTAVKRSTFAQDALDLFGDIRRNTAQAGSTSTTIVLDAGASATDDWYKNGLIMIVGGTGAGQFRTISSYTGASKTATVGSAWSTTPDNTSVFAILAAGGSVDSTTVANAVWDASRSGHTTTGSFGEGINVVSIATAAANTVRDSILNFSHRTGRTVKGFIRRLDALASGKATGLIGTVATFFQPDGTTVEYTADQDTTAGTRGTATVTNSET